MTVTSTADNITIVDKPTIQPAKCIASMTMEDPKGFVDTLLTPAVIDPRVYLSVSYIEDVARKLGMSYTEGIEAEKSELEARVEQLEAELAEADKRLDAIDVMESAGFTARKKPARKPAAKKTTAKVSS